VTIPVPAVRTAGTGDRHTIAAVLGAAFTRDPVWNWLIGPHRMDDRRVGRALAALALPHVAHGHSTLTSDGSSIAVWAAPKRFRIRPGEFARHLPAMVRSLGAGGMRRLLQLGEMEHLHPTEPHWYLALLGTHPSQTGRGLASAVMAPVLERADAEGTGCWVESSDEDNVPFYERHGFVVVDTFRIAGGRGPTVPLMWRDPRPD